MKASKFFVFSAALLALVLSSVSASAQKFHNGPKDMAKHPHMEMTNQNIEKIAEKKAEQVSKQYNLDQASYRKLVNHYKKEMKQMKKQSEMRMDNEKELKAILGPENYKAYKHQAKMHGNHYGKPDHNHVERPVPHEVK